MKILIATDHPNQHLLHEALGPLGPLGHEVAGGHGRRRRLAATAG